MKKPNPEECVLKTCDRRKDNPAALVCNAHWKLVPNKLKQALWAAEKLRSLREREFQVLCRADDILGYLEKQKVILPPEVKLATAAVEIEKPDTIEPRILFP